MPKPTFKYHRTLDEISKFAWQEYGYGQLNGLPVKYNEADIDSVTFLDIKMWEQIYHAPGNFGIYAAWDPLVEYYIIVYYWQKTLDKKIEHFLGNGAQDKIVERSKELGISLESNTVLVDNK